MMKYQLHFVEFLNILDKRKLRFIDDYIFDCNTFKMAKEIQSSPLICDMTDNWQIGTKPY